LSQVDVPGVRVSRDILSDSGQCGSRDLTGGDSSEDKGSSTTDPSKSSGLTLLEGGWGVDREGLCDGDASKGNSGEDFDKHCDLLY